MIVVRLSGGLGNQMFQYALYLRLRSLGRVVKFDDRTEYELENARPIMLSVFGAEYERASVEEVVELTDSSMKLFRRIGRKIFGRKSKAYYEASCDFDAEVLGLEEAYLCGCFQSERYFECISDEVKRVFVFRDEEIGRRLEGKSGERLEVGRGRLEADGGNFEGNDEKGWGRIEEYVRRIEGCESVCIHIRRGDYLDAQEVYGGICTEAYYEGAIRYVSERVADARFFVFTNDTAWALEWRAKQVAKENFIIVEGATEETGYLDLMLMIKCRHHIIANSSFSWWGAWLGRKEMSVTVAPSVWFGDRECKDIYTEWMTRLDARGAVVGAGVTDQVVRSGGAVMAEEMGVKELPPEEMKLEEMGEALVSVIVAVYNIEEYLRRCLDSVCGQSYRRLEIILVDDGSTDESGRICDEYASGDQRIRVIHKVNGGLSDARNAGLAIASGDYIGFVDGDDWVEPGMYEAMVTGCVQNNAQVAVCRYKQITKRGIIDASTDDSVLLTRNEALEIYVCGHDNYIIYNSVWSKLFAREVIQEMEFPVGRKSEDIMFTTKAFCRMDRCFYLDRAYYNYVLDREGSIMNQGAGERRMQDEIPFWQEQIQWLRKEIGDGIADKAMYHLCRRLLYYYVDFMRSKETRPFGGLIVKLLRGMKREIWAVYEKEFVAGGDKLRMRLMLAAPKVYYQVVRFYDFMIIPLRNLGSKSKSKSKIE